MYEKHLCGIDTPHADGFCFKVNKLPFWLLMQFSTPFYYRTDNTYGEGNPGDCILHPPGVMAEHGPLSANTSFINDWIYFSADPKDMQALQLPLNICIPNVESRLLAPHLKKIQEESLNADSYSAELISNRIKDMLIYFKRAGIQSDADSIPRMTKLSEVRLNILSNPQIHWTLESMAAQSGYCVSRFCKLYTEAYQTSPLTELIEHRIEKAKLLLKLNSHSITEVAELCGFSSVHYFSNTFKKRVGVTPKAYK